MKLSAVLIGSYAAAVVRAAPTGDAFTSPGWDSPITRKGTELQLDGKHWSASGANVYWLGLVS